MAQMTTPRAMSTMLAALAFENCSVPMKTPVAYTRPGMSDLVIWMKETDRYRYAELDSHRLAAYRTPVGHQDTAAGPL